jgi:hypothetical protein
MADFIDEVMGFNPSDLNAFNEPEVHNFDANVYKTNPKDTKSEDGNYRSKVRVIYNPANPKDSIIHQATYYLKSADGGLLVRSRLGNGSLDPNFKDCPIFKAWKRIWFASKDPVETEKNKTRAKDLFNKNEADYVLVQILEDDNKPDLVGKFMAMKLPTAVRAKLEAKMKPSKESKKFPYPVMDYVIGLELNMDVVPGPDDPVHPERKQREISYDICDFGDYAPIIKTDGSPLFTDEQLELIDSYVTAYRDSTGAKTEAKKKAALNQLEALRPQLKPLYQIAYEYVKENAFDIREDRGWKEWDEQTATKVNHWIEIVDDGKDPSTITYEDWKKAKAKENGDGAAAEKAPATEAPESPEAQADGAFGEKPDDLPF